MLAQTRNGRKELSIMAKANHERTKEEAGPEHEEDDDE